MADRYSSISELRQFELEGRDFRIRCRHGVSPFAIAAPHGGRIERGTSSIAEGIAGHEHTFYAFEGCKTRGNHLLHITSDRFDEPCALTAVCQVATVITVHGAKGDECAVYGGGLDLILRRHLLTALANAGFMAEDDPSPTRQGRGATNLCNRGRSGRGVQLELTAGLRRAMLLDPQHPDMPTPNALFHQFVDTVRAALSAYKSEIPY